MMSKQGSSAQHLEAMAVVTHARDAMEEDTREVFAMGACVSFANTEGGESVQGEWHANDKTLLNQIKENQ
jgi:hypothetical protein